MVDDQLPNRRSASVLDLQNHIAIDASPEVVFPFLTKIPTLWWVLASPQAERLSEVVFEAKLGGNLFVRWRGGRADEGAILASVVAIREPDFLVLNGSLGLPGVFNTVSFTVSGQGLITNVLIGHQAIGEFDDEFVKAMSVIWQDMLRRLKAFVDISVRPLDPNEGQSRDNGASDRAQFSTEPMLESAYMELQSNLIQVRQAVASAIANEKQLEQQLQKNKDQVATWVNRAEMAVQQNNEDLANQARQRGEQYAEAARELEEQLNFQKEATAGMRSRLVQLEAGVQKAWTKKQVLVAREKAAEATRRANELLSKTTASGALSVIDRMEQLVLEREAKAAAFAELGGDVVPGTIVAPEATQSLSPAEVFDRVEEEVSRKEAFSAAQAELAKDSVEQKATSEIEVDVEAELRKLRNEAAGSEQQAN